jgi:predicted RNA-binding Zn-ribbon protein involved in translation (DUF1610 family)
MDRAELNQHCPTCGVKVRVEGHTTKHYVPDDGADRIRELEGALRKIADNDFKIEKSQAIAREVLSDE